ncbi:MAG: AMP-binding protein [Betaproteobacteria bacterium]|jgi:phenylacetate-CoA ligase|nr:AMP-binding protein [Betaproteobacteria bacterium]
MPFPYELVAASADCQLLAAQMRLERAAGRAWIEATARRRAEALVAHARERSPYYRERYRELAPDAPLAELPPVRKRELMSRFDDWATDRRITRAKVERFLAEPGNIGEPFLRDYVVWTSSGTTGEPGVFVQEAAAMAAYDALIAAQADVREWGPREVGRWARSSGGGALVVATGAPYPAIVAWRRLARINPLLGGGAYPITLPLHELAAALERDRPAFLSTYPTMALLLALERNARRLAIEPAAVWCGGECLSPFAREAIEQAFDCRVHDEYGAAECFAIGSACALGAMHCHADWAILEPVDRAGRPVPPGEPSHTVLLTNLANHLQPLIRYDLGDSIRVLAEPCACGSPLPVIEVQGRSDDVIALAAPGGATVAIVPLALEAVVEAAVGAVPFQVVAAGPAELRLRLRHGGDGAPGARARSACRKALREFLAAQGAPDVRVMDDAQDPVVDARSGKLRRVLAAAP